ncbi:HAD superfamily hydrolase (TIGR01490 family) [Sporomusaceae bacterium BoRhaA]|uniref:HAD family hydrolase n=1 Tax=Pelorhabdus rhamnosifermentans TaxID=2772457 RepID=UPI001C0639B8|nr:HAD family hydrolase [Pelorhabdus rhamnosifermentans]MBU2699727.1 HAD superfamily hydrolase (TIGR01490 family) [Pelorhabdus rhamnosifermentans]
MPEDTNALVVAAFDFDGTITYHDSFIPFLWFISKKTRFITESAHLLPKLLAFKLGRISNITTKEAFITAFLKGKRMEEIRISGKKFARTVIPRFIRHEMMTRIAWHKKQGHICVLISASFDFYLATWAKDNGFDMVLSSQLEVDPCGKITGKLLGCNCYGAEKVRKLNEWLGDRAVEYLYVYGDSRGDLELLARANEKYFRGKKLT